MIAADHRILTPDTRQVDWTQPVNWRDPLNDGLVSWWIAIPNHTSGTSTWRDLCGLNDGTLTNFANVDTAWKTQGQAGGFGALEFDGTNDYATVPVTSSLEPPQMTVTAWIRYDHDDNEYFADIVGSSHGGTDSLGWVFEKGGNYLNALCSFSDSFKTINVLGGGFSSQTVGDGEWHQIAIVASSDLFSVYTDAKLGGTQSVSGGVTHSDRDVIFGKWWQGGRHYEGDISDVRIWSRALTASEIQDYYHRSQRFYPGLLTRHTRRSIFLPSAAEPDTGTGGSRRVVIPTVSTPDTRQVDWTQPVADHPLNDGLVSWWLAVPNHTSGTSTWRDLCGLNDGTLTNMDAATDWVTSRRGGGFGGAIEFAGTTNYVTLGSPSSLDIAAGPMSVSAWVYAETSSGVDGILCKELRYQLYLNSGTAEWALYNGAQNPYVTSSFDIRGGWHWVAATRGQGEIALYVDGQSQGTATDDAGDISSSDNVSIGTRRVSSSGERLQGQLDDVRIWDRALTADEIHDYYHRSQRYYPGLLKRPTRRSVFLPISTGVTISPDTLTMTGSLQGAPPNISRTINVT